MSVLLPWRVAGTYFEACNCEAICPCRRVGERLGGRSTYETCDFALSWRVLAGHAGALDVSGLNVVMAGSYSDDEPGSPWRVALYVDARAAPEQHHALAEIFLGRAGGTSLQNFAALIDDVYAIRRVHIELEHARRRQEIRVGQFVTVLASDRVESELPVSCSIPGHDRPGEEVVTKVQRVDDDPLRWSVTGRCGFATEFDYRSD